MNIFISSTVYDLVDIRSELFDLLSQEGFDVRLSDIVESSFEATLDRSSIEVCLENVKSCDLLILILDKRYGPKLAKFGYGDFSATHLEFNEAVLNKKKILVLIRDKSHADYSIFKKLGRPADFEGVWVSAKERSLFDLFEAATSLQGKDKNNWFFTFDNSVGIKKIVSKFVGPFLLAEELPRRISRGQFALLSAQMNVTQDKPGTNLWKARIDLTNYSSAVCYLKEITILGVPKGTDDPVLKDVIFPQDSTNAGFIADISSPVVDEIVIKYGSVDGIQVIDSYKIEIGYVSFNHERRMRSKLTRKSRKFLRVEPILFEVEQ